MQEASQPPPILVDEAGVVVGDVACRGCAHNLRGLRADSKCPECATAVALSIRGNLLRYCEPWWIDRLAMGASLILCALMIDAFIGSPPSYFLQPNQRWVLFASSLLAFWGTWLLTIPDPGGHEKPRLVMARRIARVGLAIVVGRSIALFFLGALPPNVSALIGLGFLVAAVASVAGEVARLYYLRQIALRIPDEKAAWIAAILSWGFGISLGVLAIFSAAITFVLLAFTQPPRWMTSAFSLVQGVMQLAYGGVILFSLIYAITLVRLVSALRAQKKMAKAARMEGNTGEAPVPQQSDHETSSLDLAGSGRGGGTRGS